MPSVRPYSSNAVASLANGILVPLVVALAALPGAHTLSAQVPVADRAPDGLFGSVTPDPTTRQLLDLTVSMTGEVDADVSTADPLVRQLVDPEGTANVNVLAGTAHYRLQRGRVQLHGIGSSGGRHDRKTGNIGALRHSASGVLTSSLPWKSRLEASQTATYTPPYQYTAFPAVPTGSTARAAVVTPDHGVNNLEAYSSVSQVTITHDHTPRSSVMVVAQRAETDYRSAAGEIEMVDLSSMIGTLAHRRSRNTRATVQYLYREGTFPGDRTTDTTSRFWTEQGIELGGSYTPRFSATRRMAFDAGIGSSLLSIPDPLDGVRRRSYRLVGQMSAAYLLKAWQARAQFRRGVESLEGVIEPVWINGYLARIDGSITHRLDLRLIASYASGQSVMNRGAASFDTYSSDARLRFAITPAAAVHVEYVYFFYDFRGSAFLAPGIPVAFERNGLRAGLTLLLPVMRR